MTNERAVEILKKLIPQPRRGDGKSTTHLMITEALDMAIKALEEQRNRNRHEIMSNSWCIGEAKND